MSTNKLTQKLIEDGESPKVELIGDLDNYKQVAKAVAAFLNTNGGTVVVGVDKQQQVAVAADQKSLKKLQEFLNRSLRPHTLFAVSLDDTDFGRVIVIEVPKGRDRPFVVNGATYVRKGSTIKPADAGQLRKMVEEDTDRPRWERRVSAGLGLEDLDATTIQKTVRSAIDLREMSFPDDGDHLQVLNHLSMTQFDEITNAADVAFGINVTGRHPQTRVRAVCYETDRAGDHFFDDQLFEGPVLRIYDDAMAFFRRHVSVSNTFAPGQAMRETKPDYPFKSLREGLINALAHRDYESYSGSASLSIYPNRIEIWNFGSLTGGLTPKKLEKAKHDSILVNPDISNVLYLNGLMERIGRGTYNIVQECDEYGMPSPKWENTAAGVKLTLYSATLAGSKAVLSELNSRQRELLRVLRPGDATTVKEFAKRFEDEDLSIRQARRDLSELVEIGAFEQIGLGRATVYERTEKF